MGWIINNGMALYGAITGTLALGISYFAHRHNVAKDRIKLSVEFSPHPVQKQNIERLRIPKNIERPWEPCDAVEIIEYYVVTVRNVGTIPAPITDVGVKTKDGAIYPARGIKGSDNICMLKSIAEMSLKPLAAHSCQSFHVYLGREQPEFVAISAYAIDQTGKEWLS